MLVRQALAWLSFIALVLVNNGMYLRAQAITEHTVYTVTDTEVNGENTFVRKIYRNGSKVVDELNGGTGGSTTHNRSVLDLKTHQEISWSLDDSATFCVKRSFDGWDWDTDPFQDPSQDLTDLKARQVGTQNVAGYTAKVFEYPRTGGVAKVWIDSKSNLLLRIQVTPTDGVPRTTFEVTSLSFAPPPASIFVLPSKCAAAAAGPRVPTTRERIAFETGSDPNDFQMTLGPGVSFSDADPTLTGHCTVVFRVVHSGSMEPVTSGFQVALDPTATWSHQPSYSGILAKDGHMISFAGGDLHEIKSQSNDGIFRIEDAPAEFDLYLNFRDDHTPAIGVIRRRCYAPETVLLYVVTNPAKMHDKAEWLWVKSGKYSHP